MGASAGSAASLAAIACVVACGCGRHAVDDAPDASSIVVRYDAAPPEEDAPGADAAYAPDGDAPPPGACRPDAAPPAWGKGFREITGPIGALLTMAPIVSGSVPIASGGAFVRDDDTSPAYLVAWSDTKARAFAWTGAGLVQRPEWSVPPLFFGFVDLDGDGRTDPIGGSVIEWRTPTLPTPNVFPTTDAPLGPLSFADLDHDGWVDLVGTSQGCCATCTDFRPILRGAGGKWAERTDLVDAEAVAVSTFAVLATEVGAGDFYAFAIGNTCPNQATLARGSYGVVGTTHDGFPRFAAKTPLPPNPYYAAYDVVPHPPGTPFTLSSPMGGASVDLDDDGLEDLVLSLAATNVYAGTTSPPLVDETLAAGVAVRAWRVPERVTPWGVVPVDLDQDGRQDLVVAHGHDAGGWMDPARVGIRQRVSVEWNAGGFCFADATAGSGLDREGEFYGIAADDPDEDGDADLVIGGQGEIPRVYRNDIPTGHHGFSLRLGGTSSNAPALGARVTVQADGEPDRHFVVSALGGPSLSTVPPLFVGLGDATRASLVRVTWPTGVVQEIRDLDAGHLHRVREPPAFEVSPPLRTLPADGFSTATIRVTPRDLAGAPRAGKVEVRVAAGMPVGIGAPAADAGGVVFRVTASPTPSSTVFSIVIDGKELRVRPRVFWTPP